MITLTTPPRSHCPINFGLEIFGDRWTLLVLRDVLIEGKRSFKEFQGSAETIASNVLAQRLKLLVSVGLLTPEKCGTDQRKIIYQPTEAAKALIPALVELAYWGATHDLTTAAPEAFVKACENDKQGLVAMIQSGRFSRAGVS